jgi:hypothetical protein
LFIHDSVFRRVSAIFAAAQCAEDSTFIGATDIEAACDLSLADACTVKLPNLAVPLSQLTAIEPDEDTAEAIGDWHYWVAQGYLF